MSDADDSGTDTPGTDQEEIDEDARMLGNEPEREPIDEPTLDNEQEAQQMYWMAKEVVAIGIISIFAFLLLAFGLMQATGLIALPGPLQGSLIANWSLFIILAVILAAVLAWSQWRT